mgnify:CR=1 FL=1
MPANTLPGQLQATADYIENLQLPSGALPWFAGGITDPWDHVEALMGLTVAGRFNASLKGFEWLSRMQRSDGAWYAAYQDEAVADDPRADTSFGAAAGTGSCDDEQTRAIASPCLAGRTR